MLKEYTFHYKALVNLGISLLVLIAVIFLLNGLLNLIVVKKKKSWLRAIHIKGNEIISIKMMESMITNVIVGFKWILVLFILYVSIPFVLQELPTTHDYAITLMNSIQLNLEKIGNSFLSFIPNLFYIAFVVVVVRAILKFLKFLFLKVEHGEIYVHGFYPEWANTTFQLLRFFILAFSLVIIYPYLPGSGTKALEGVSVFLGLLISIGSSSAIANIIAGVMISYMRAFKIGDYVKIGESTGRVIEKGLIVTKIITYKNEEVTIPNTQVLNSQVTNYSTEACKGDLLLYTTITIGYDVPWPKVHKMMIEAAEKSELISQEKKAFVLQTALNDFHISYQLNAFTKFADKIPEAYSELHQNIQQMFSQNNVEIMSPGFTVLRNTPKNTTPNL